MNTYRKKLIEVALPLEAINVASAREKSIRHGHPSTLHLWWARRPLAAARAVIFAQMVDDPSAWPDLFPTEKAQEKERKRLFKIIEELVLWENTTNEVVLQKARNEIWQSWRRACAENADHPNAKELFDRNKLPAFHDPFAGGGALPLEAQRLGLESFASDLNPVAVLINKAMIEIPPKFAGRPPVNPEFRKNNDLIAREWTGAQGLAEDVRYYAQWMRDEAEKKIGHHYPKIEIIKEIAEERSDLKPFVGKQLTVIAWLWARTVKSPNPAFADVDVPLISTYMLSSKIGKETYIEPVVDSNSYRFRVKVGNLKGDEKNGTKLARGANFKCLMSGSPIPAGYIRSEAQAGRMGVRLMAIVAEGERGRVYLPPWREHEVTARQAQPVWKPELKVPTPCHDVDRLPMYGMPTWGDAFTPRQLVALTTFSDLVQEALERVHRDALAAGLSKDGKPLCEGGTGAEAYADAVAVYLGILVDKMAFLGSSMSYWEPAAQCPRGIFGRQAIAMTWDYAEPNVFSESSGCWSGFMKSLLDGVQALFEGCNHDQLGYASQADASIQDISINKVVSTDPPYYDNISYADLSDFFYIWLRRSLKPVFPDLFVTLAVPKTEELVATPYRHGSKEKAEAFFLKGMTLAMQRLAAQSHPAFPVTIYYAFKQSESDATDGTSSTGWETFLDAVIRAGFAITGTWPMRTEMIAALKDMTNALASSIVLVCRPKQREETLISRREFQSNLKKELPIALRNLQKGNIAPVDLAQASIGPGMAIFTRYAKVLENDGLQMSVRSALLLINETLDEVLAEQEGEFDADTRWALAWFEQSGFNDGSYGIAETLCTAKNTSVSGMVDAGMVAALGGKVRLLKKEELSENWDPTKDTKITVWEMVHYLVRAQQAGEDEAAELFLKLGPKSEVARDLAYRLFSLCEKKKWAKEALDYNGLVIAWPDLVNRASALSASKSVQPNLV